MYPFERYLGTLKSYVRSRVHPEASMANGYAAEEALGFCTEYRNLQAYTSRHVWETEEDQGMVGSVVEGRGRILHLSSSELAKAHKYVIEHHGCTMEMKRYDHRLKFPLKCYCSPICSTLIFPTEFVLSVLLSREYERELSLNPHLDPFDIWLRDRCAQLPDAEGAEQVELRALSCGPSRKVCSFRSMTSFGSHYRVENVDRGARHVTFDSGVAEIRLREEGMNNSEQGGVVDLARVGTLQDIWVLNYVHVNIVLMVVSWVAKDTESHPRLRRDPHGFWLANLTAVPRCRDSPFILPIMASQVPPQCI